MSNKVQDTLKKQIISTTHRVWAPLSECYTLGEIQEKLNQLIDEHGKNSNFSFIVTESGEIQEEVSVSREETNDEQKKRIQREIDEITSQEENLSATLLALRKGLKKI